MLYFIRTGGYLMADILTQGEKNLELLRKSIPKNERLWLWCIDPNGPIISTDCPKPEAFISAFKAMDGLKRALERALDCNPRPLLISTAVGMQWAAAFEPNEKGLTRHIYLLGPVFYRDLSIREVREGLELYANAGADLKWRSELINVIGSIPVLSFAIFSRYAILLHNLLNSEQLSVTDLSGRDLPEGFIQAKKSEKPHDRHRVWQAETALLQMVKNGDIGYQEALANSIALSDGVPVHGRDPMRQAKTSAIVFTSIVVRAAIEGGMSPETAYSLGDSYIQAAEDSRDTAEITSLVYAMYDDFIHRVHRCRTNPAYSREIQKCCDYIELNMTRPIRASDLGNLVGYTEYYLSEKFKKETGVSVSTYIKYAKIERAKVILKTTSQSVQTIAERLAFNTPNYFIQSFKEVVGCTPAQYRKTKN